MIIYEYEYTSIEFHYRIAAHRMILYLASNYFRALFDTPLTDKDKLVYSIPGISGDILERVIEFCYHNTIDINEDNVDWLLAAASYLQVPDLEVRCIQYYRSCMRASNCLGIWAVAEKYASEELKRKAQAFVFRNIKEVVKCEEFMQLSTAQLDIILKSDDLNIDREADVFNALVQWVNFNVEERKNSFETLFQHIRLQHIEESVSLILLLLIKLMHAFMNEAYLSYLYS